MDTTTLPETAETTAVIHLHPPRVATPRREVDPALLQSRARGLMVEYTSRCNLRCKYCSKSNPGDDQIPGRDEDMAPQTIEQVLALIAAKPMSELMLAGTGESTFHKDWLTDIPRLIAAGKAANPQCYVHLNSNLALKYGDAEFAVLAQLDGIVVSIDTADRELTRSVRAKSDLGLIVFNMLALKAWCAARGQRAPKLMVNATYYQQAARRIVELVQMMAMLPIEHLAISDMVELPATQVHGVASMNTDDRAAFIESVQQLQQAMNFAQNKPGFKLVVQPHLIERINGMIARLNSGGAAPEAVAADAVAPAAQRTKLCLQPWTRFTVAADGALFPCCVTDMPPVGHIGRDGEGIDGPAIQAFRRALLVGEVPPVCVGCTNAPHTSTAELEATVRALQQRAH